MTEQEIKEFWEKLGFKWANIRWDYHYERGQRVADWLYPDGTFHRDLPSLTGIEALGNLFRWAVPKLQEVSKEHYITFEHPFNEPTIWAVTINVELHYNYKEFEGRDNDPAIALFRAIQQVIKEGV